jgi:deoxycytidine triphosphate deaminase
MKRQNPLIIPATILLLGIALDSFAGSVILTHARIESLLLDAGFQIHTGPDAQRQLRYLRTTPYTVERHIDNGQVVYTYADPRAGFLYTGGQFEYQQYKRVVREASISEERWQTSEALAKPWQDWDWTWKPWKLLRWGYENFPND